MPDGRNLLVQVVLHLIRGRFRYCLLEIFGIKWFAVHRQFKHPFGPSDPYNPNPHNVQSSVSVYLGIAGGVNAFDFTQASRKWFRFGERNAPSIPGLSAM